MAKTTTYDDLVGQNVFARLRDSGHPEWQKCNVVSVISAGIKLRSQRTHEEFIIDNNDVREDLRLCDAFIPWEREQKPYNGKYFLLFKCQFYC